jgi:hypothetical protein
MAAATHLTIRLVRFDRVRDLDDVGLCPIGDPLWTGVGADVRAAGAPQGAATAFTWAAVGFFADESTARASFEAGSAAVPWAAGAAEVWTALLQPFTHRGETNWVDPARPGPVFATGRAPAPGERMAVLTTVGWNFGPDLDMDRVADFGVGVGLIRDSMNDVDGLHSQQTFTPPGGGLDPFTFTIWRDDAAMRAFAYRPGVHKEQMDRFKRLHTADRTSFTRLRALASSGTWHGTDPFDQSLETDGLWQRSPRLASR